MRHLKAIGYIVASEILSLFIGLTLASSAMTFMKLICAVCTVGILICLMANFAMNTASEDLKKSRTENLKLSPLVPLATGVTASLPSLASWIVLFVSHKTSGFDFYKWHKLLNAYFLQIYNFINSDASSSALTSAQVWLMLPLVAVPFASYVTVYALTVKGVIKAPVR
ncbi:MAG: hypothetical protein E7500_01040 [Ruminococcus sp.]|nr:hypothetical protein [Ruminococcus sp.]